MTISVHYLQIDKQSLEIERLFVENEGLRGSLKETSVAASRWEAQVHKHFIYVTYLL